VTAAPTTDGKKGIYPLFAPTSEKDRGSKKINNNNKFKDKKKKAGIDRIITNNNNNRRQGRGEGQK
jgi:hypothetical protein